MRRLLVTLITGFLLLAGAGFCIPTYLIVYTSNIWSEVSQIERLEAMKQSQGFNVITASSNYIYYTYPGLEYQDRVKEYISDIYNDPGCDLEYVLIISAQDILNPGGWINIPSIPGGDPYADDWFVDFVGNDLIPDIAIGRLPFVDSDELSNYLDKLEAYEVHRNEPWCSNVMISIEDNSVDGLIIAGMTQEEYYQTLYVTSSYIRSRFGPGYNVSELKAKDFEPLPYLEYFDRVNDGTSLQISLGCASRLGVGGRRNDNCIYSFITSDLSEDPYRQDNPITDLNNTSKYPLFYFQNCGVGDIDDYHLRGAEPLSLSELFTFVADKGAIGVLGPSGDYIEPGGYDTRLFSRFLVDRLVMYGEPVGDALKAAKWLYWNQGTHPQDLGLLSTQLYCDPSLKLCLPSDDYFPYTLSGFPIILYDSVYGSAVGTLYPPENNQTPVENPPYIFPSDEPEDVAVLTPNSLKALDFQGRTNFRASANGSCARSVLADVNSDGLFESVYCNGQLLIVLSNEGDILSGFPVDLTESIPYPPAVGDVDGDGYLNVIVVTSDKVRTFDHNGAEWSEGWPADLPADYSPVGSPAIADLDNDGNLEIVVSTTSSTNNSYLCVYENNGAPKTGYPYFLSSQHLTPPSLADLTDDGPVEIVAASTLFSGGNWDNARYYVFDDGGNKTVDVSLPGYDIRESLCVGDFVTWGGWPGKEVVLVGYDSPYFEILVRDASTGEYRNSINMGSEIVTSSPTVADINCQDTNEVVIGCQGRLMAYDLGCGLVPYGSDWDGRLYGDVSTPVVTDLDGDSHWDIICGDGEALYAFTTYAPDNVIGTYDWIREGHDNMNTGLWDIAAPTGVVAEDYPDDQGGKIIVAWTPSIDDGVRATRVTEYKIYRGEEVFPGDGGGNLAGNGSRGKKIAEGLRKGAVVVPASLSGSPDSPAEPTGGGGMDDWTFVYRGSVPAGTFYYEDDGLDNLTTYKYYVVATDGVHNSQPSKTVSAVPHDNIPPAAPTNFDGEVVDNGFDPLHVRLTWTRSVDDPLYQEGEPGDSGGEGPPAVIAGSPRGPASPYSPAAASGSQPGDGTSAASASAGSDSPTPGAISSPAAGIFLLSGKQGEAAKAKLAEMPTLADYYGTTGPRFWTDKDNGFDGGANDAEMYKIAKDAAYIYCYPDTPGNDVEYLDYDVSPGNIYYYTLYAQDGENDSDAVGPVVADLTQIPGDGGTLAYAPPGVPADTDIGFKPRSEIPTVSDPFAESGWSGSGAKTSHVITCKPNPVTGAATFTITLPSATRVRLDVYDLSGRKVDTVINGMVEADGHSVVWNPAVPNGVYVYRLEAPGRRYAGKVAVAR